MKLTLDKAYNILNVSPDASNEEVEAAYRAQAKKTHPDLHPDDPYAENNFQLLQEAKMIIDEHRKKGTNHSSYTYNQQQSSNQNNYNTYSSNENTNRYYSSQSKSSNFASEHSLIMNKMYDVYSYLRKRKYHTIEENSDYREVAYRCAYGVLLRHALECMLHDKAKEIHVITERRSSDQLLTFIIDNYPFDSKTKKVYYDAKFITNKLTHIDHFSDSRITFESCREFYNNVFKSVIETHLSSGKVKKHSYLRKIYDELENFNIKNRITETLLLANLMRQLLECIVDLWLYNENAFRVNWNDECGVKEKLDMLKALLESEHSKKMYYAYSTHNNLHAIRKAANQALHVSSNNKMNITKIRSILLAQTKALETEVKMPTRKEKAMAAKRFPWKKVLLWVFLFPVMLIITICKSEIGLFKKIFWTALILVLAISLISDAITWIENKTENVSGSIFDDSIVIDGNLKFEENGIGYTVSVVPEKENLIIETVVIPSTCKGLPVTAVAAGGFRNCSYVKEIVVPDSVTTIGASAFKGCDSLESITLPFVGKSLTATRHEAVLGYIFGYETISVNTSGMNLGYDDRFINQDLYAVPGATWQYSWYNYGGLIEDTTYKTYYYYIPESLKTVVITNQISVPDAAFNGCQNLSNIKYLKTPDDNITIGVAAFQNCTNLKFDGENDGVLRFNDRVVSIGEKAFYGCEGIHELIVPVYVRSIGYAAFQNCNSIESITVPFVGTSELATQHKAILGYIFGYEEINISTAGMGYDDRFVNQNLYEVPGATWQYSWYNYGVEGTSYKAYYCYIPETLKSVVITKQTAIPNAAFNGCSNLITITVPVGSTYGEFTFQNCNAKIIEE